MTKLDMQLFCISMIVAAIQLPALWFAAIYLIYPAFISEDW